VAHLGDRVATGFGQRTLLLEFSEPVDAASVTPSAVRLTSGTLPTQFAGQADPNSVAGTQEADATVLDVKPYDVQGGRTRYAAVTLDNFFGIDTGDALAFVPGGVRDVAGNALRDAALATATFVDQTPPMIKRVALQADETISVVFTKFVHVTPPTGSSTGDMEPSLFGFSNVDAARLGLSSVALITLPAAREQMATLTVTDASWLRGYNSGLPNCSRGSRVVLQGVRNADHNSTAGGPGVAGTDDGTQAYVNVVPDPADPANSPGAYALNNSPMGVRSSFADTLGPRLSRFAADTSLATSANRVSVPPNGNSSDLRLTVVLTELTRSFVDGTDPASAANAANWRVAITDLGLDNDWTGNGPNDPSPTQATAEVVGVRFTGNASAPCGSETSRYELTVRVRNDSASSKVFGARSIALSRNVTDAAGNVVTLHNGWVYDPARPGQPGWVRDSL
jgi:hypothetical protein